MEPKLQQAFINGVERLNVWADILDQINVFPVPDSDTGTNLVVSLTPLRQINGNSSQVITRLLESACGNSGNIAARFFSGMLTVKSLKQLEQACQLGRDFAWKAVQDPRQGTMLTIFDSLIEVLGQESGQYYHAGQISFENNSKDKILDHLKKSVLSTKNILPQLKQANVVDSGALGMFIFFEGFFNSISGNEHLFQPLTKTFKGSLNISPGYLEKYLRSPGKNLQAYCVNALVKSSIRSGSRPGFDIDCLSGYGESIVISSDDELLKIHAHTNDTHALRKKIETLGKILEWSEESLVNTNKIPSGHAKAEPVPVQGSISLQDFDPKQFHIMTDAAGSFPARLAKQLGITILNSYILSGNKALPENCFDPSELYRIMKKGEKVSTSQASVFERHQHYQKLISQYQNVLYLCVGSVYTGNYNTASAWKQENDLHNKMTIIDTGAASGRLGVIALMCARYLYYTNPGAAKNQEDIIKFAENAISHCEEYVFLDRLKYLAASGRMSKTGALFGDILHMKPVISPLAEGAKKVGMVKNKDSQVKFALDRLSKKNKKESQCFILIQYTDNKKWVKDIVMHQIKKSFPNSEIILCPLSLTSGVHMGPGTWSISFLPGSFLPGNYTC